MSGGRCCTIRKTRLQRRVVHRDSPRAGRQTGGYTAASAVSRGGAPRLVRVSDAWADGPRAAPRRRRRLCRPPATSLSQPLFGLSRAPPGEAACLARAWVPPRWCSGACVRTRRRLALSDRYNRARCQSRRRWAKTLYTLYPRVFLFPQKKPAAVVSERARGRTQRRWPGENRGAGEGLWASAAAEARGRRKSPLLGSVRILPGQKTPRSTAPGADVESRRVESAPDSRPRGPRGGITADRGDIPGSRMGERGAGAGPRNHRERGEKESSGPMGGPLHVGRLKLRERTTGCTNGHRGGCPGKLVDSPRKKVFR